MTREGESAAGKSATDSKAPTDETANVAEGNPGKG
jgi:hypothetical protein